MIALIQRVTDATVTVGAETIASIGRGILALIAVQPADTESVADRLLERIVGYRIFDDGEGRMNLALTDIGGELLLVSQFTLAADTRKGDARRTQHRRRSRDRRAPVRISRQQGS